MKWFLPSNRYDEIRLTVSNLIEDWGISVYPFCIWSLLRKMGISVVPYSALPEDIRNTLLTYYPDAFTIYPSDFNPVKTTIYYNDEIANRNRIRFTLAHELAHLVLMHLGTDDIIYEHEADIFANYLLVPAPLIIESASFDYEVVSTNFVVSHGCAASACDRAIKRIQYGPMKRVEYEQRILDYCSLRKGGDELAIV